MTIISVVIGNFITLICLALLAKYLGKKLNGSVNIDFSKNDEIKQIFDNYNIKVDTGTSKDEKKIIKILKNIPKNIIEKNLLKMHSLMEYS